MRRKFSITVIALCIAVLPQAVRAQNHHHTAPDGMKTATPAGLKWAPFQPEGFAPGMEVAPVLGDPSVPNQPFVIRVRFKDGYRMPAHYHPTAENITVLSGTFLLQMGDAATENMTEYGADDFIQVPPLKPHYGGAKGETVLQVHGVGPFQVMLAKPGAGSGK